MHAFRRVSTREPTEVPKELATSLAPTPKAKMKEMMKPAIVKGSSSSDQGSMVTVYVYVKQRRCSTGESWGDYQRRVGLLLALARTPSQLRGIIMRNNLWFYYWCFTIQNESIRWNIPLLR